VEILRGDEGLAKKGSEVADRSNCGLPLELDSHSALSWIKLQMTPKQTVQTKLPPWNIHSFMTILMSKWANPE
jgi:hypothetical protein